MSGYERFHRKKRRFHTKFYTREDSQKYQLFIKPVKTVRILFSIYKYLLNPRLPKSGMPLSFQIQPGDSFPTKSDGLLVILKKVWFPIATTPQSI